MLAKAITILSLLFCLHDVKVSAQINYYTNRQLQPLRTEDIISGDNLIVLPGQISVRDSGAQYGHYIISDHMGSAHCLMNNQNNLLFSCAYDPYGNINTALPDGQKKYCSYMGYSRDDKTDLYNTPTRKYSPATKTFLSQDLLLSDPSRYVFNHLNPVRYQDANGASPVDDIANQIRANENFMKLGNLPSVTKYEEEQGMDISQRQDSDDPLHKALKRQMEGLRHALQKRAYDYDEYYSPDEIHGKLISSGTYRIQVYKHNIANCGECAAVMLGVLHESYPGAYAEQVHGYIEIKDMVQDEVWVDPREIVQSVDHSFNILNRDPATDVKDPSSWNEEAIVVDAWRKVVFTREEFLKEYYELKNKDYNFSESHKKARIKILEQFKPEKGFPPLFEQPISAPKGAAAAHPDYEPGFLPE